MDSRLKKQVIVAAAVMVAAVVVMVLVANYIKTGNGIFGNGDAKEAQSGGIQAAEAAGGSSGNGQADAGLEDPAGNAGAYGLDPDKDPYAFLSDEAFFDPVVEVADPESTLSLFVTSVEKDMRVNVVNGNGVLMGDIPFVVTVTDSEGKERNYRDADKDGSIYIAPVDPGDYQVSLQETDGYVLAEEAVPVTVKEQIDYTVIDDISFMIKSVDEIDEAQEDTAINDAELNADGTESTKRLDAEDALFGIDVSKWNKEIDWERVAASGVEFVIIRCGYRGSKTGALVEDPCFRKNIEGAEAAGLKVGVYFFTQATTEVEAVEEASMALMLCRNYKLALPVFIDTEGAGGSGRADGLDADTRTAVCEAFCRTIENAGGFNAGVYASKNWFEKNLHTEDLTDYTIWLAQYSRTATYQGDYDLWQYTSAGTVDGIDTRVDLNMCYQDY